MTTSRKTDGLRYWSPIYAFFYQNRKDPRLAPLWKKYEPYRGKRSPEANQLRYAIRDLVRSVQKTDGESIKTTTQAWKTREKELEKERKEFERSIKRKFKGSAKPKKSTLVSHPRLRKVKPTSRSGKTVPAQAPKNYNPPPFKKVVTPSQTALETANEFELRLLDKKIKVYEN